MHYTSKDVYEFISKQTNDPIVQRKTCTVSGVEFPIYQSDLDFYDKISPIFNGVKYQIPTPTLCPEERQRRRSTFRNERKLYHRTCDATGKQIISIYSPDKSYKVYDQKYRRSDNRDPMKYGKDFDFNSSFTKQFDTLIQKVPRANFYGNNNENSDYTNHCNYSKDCYMCADLVKSEKCMYSTTGIDSINIMDSILLTKCNNCYACIDSNNLYDCSYCIQSNNCKKSVGLTNCERCENCINSSNIIDKKYFIDNRQGTKEEYEERIKNNIGGFSYKDISRSSWIINSPLCFGNQILNSKKVVHCFLLYDSDTVKYSFISGWMNDCYDCYETGVNSSLLYENHAVMGSYNVSFASISYENKFCLYIDNCYNSEYLFGCVGLRNKKYCIFNKQYTKKEYEQLVPKIIQHMQKSGERGEFFSTTISPFGYNETVAHEYYPLSRESAIQRGYKRQDLNYDPKIPESEGVVIGKKLPTDIAKISDDICKKIITCEVTGRPFRVIKPELDFYRKHNIPIPHKHPDVRYKELLQQRDARNSYLRKCDHCSKEIISIHDENVPYKVYCEECYNKEIYG